MRRVCAECEDGGKASDGGCVGGADASHGDGEDVDFNTGPVVAESIGERGVFVADELCGEREVIVCAVLPFTYLGFLA
jgi:hypothetical protein